MGTGSAILSVDLLWHEADRISTRYHGRRRRVELNT